MSRDIIRIRGQYVLEVGQGLLDQAPYNQVVPHLTEKYQINPKLFQRGILTSAKTLEDLPRLPFVHESHPDRLSEICYNKIKRDLTFASDQAKESLEKALKEMGNTLIRFPKWLRYLHVSNNLVYPSSYDEGEWIYQSPQEGRKAQPDPRSRMEAALSYPYWAYQQQIKVGLIRPAEIDPSVLSDAQVTAAIERRDHKLISERWWQLLAAPKFPIIMKEKRWETPNNYRQKFMDELDDIPSYHSHTAEYFNSNSQNSSD